MEAQSRVDRAARAGSTTAVSRRRPPGHPALELQRAAGNRAVAALVQRQPATAAAPTAQQQAGHDAAVADHLKQQKRVYDLIAGGRTGGAGAPTELDRLALFRNACQWIASGKVKTRILSPTHDFGARQPGKRAYFDYAILHPAEGGDYAVLPDSTDDDHVMFTPPGYQGGMSNHNLELFDPAGKTDDELVTTLIHEVQHDADETGFGRPGASLGAAGLTGVAQLGSAVDFNQYQSEFRAHWTETTEGSPADHYGSSKAPATNAKAVPVPGSTTTPPATVPTAFTNERQERIFWWLDTNGYPFAGTYATDAAFKEMVDGFDHPAGVNLVNSLRISAVLDALGACKPDLAAGDAPVKAVLDAFDALDSNDLVFLQSPDSDPFWAFAVKHVPLAVYTRLSRRARLPVEDYGPPPSPPGTAAA